MDTCSLCCDESKAWAVGLCEHATCLLCSVRLRVLCEQRDCPVCREKLNKVVVSDSIKRKFSLPPHGSKVDRKYSYFFCSSHLYDKYKALLVYRCTKCHEKPTFSTFNLLRDHSRKVHSLLYCDICCENLKLFPYELRQYTRQELTRHRREGDPDNRSYKGHPLCEFCDDRFYDNDALHAHLRKVHFWCHFCESDGKQDYYSTYHLLRNHFKQEHFLCVEGDCQQEKFTSVFRTKLDLQVHRAKVHSKGVTKAEAKQMRQLDVGFTYYGRVEEPRSSSMGESYGGGSSANSGRSYTQQQQQRSSSNNSGVSSSRMNKPRECDEKSTGNIVQLIPPQQLQQQDTTKSPQLGRRKKKTSSHQHTSYDQPPRHKQRQEQKQQQQQQKPSAPELETSTKDGNKISDCKTTTTLQAKKPPGLKTPQASSDKASDSNNMVVTTSQAKKPPGLKYPPTSSNNKIPGDSSNKHCSKSDSTPVTKSQAKKPPGLKSPPYNTMNNISTTDKTSEWPDFLTLNITSEEKPSVVPPQKLNPHKSNYNPLEPAQFPPLTQRAPPTVAYNINFTTKSSLSQSGPHNEEPGSNVPPPGFMMPQWQTIQQDSIYSKTSGVSSNHMTMSEAVNSTVVPPQSVVVTEASVINMVRDALDHNREKFNYFRNLSGWYRNSEITVQDYVRRCEELFGELKWMLIGPQLAQVMPIEGKRNELIQNVYNTGMEPPRLSDYIPTSLLPIPEAPHNTSSSSNNAIHMSRSEPTLLRPRWGELSNRAVPNWESECDYPSLHAPSTTGLSSRQPRQIQPPAGLSTQSCWKARVPA